MDEDIRTTDGALAATHPAVAADGGPIDAPETLSSVVVPEEGAQLANRGADAPAVQVEPQNQTPAYDPRQARGYDWNSAAMRMIAQNGLTPADIPELMQRSISFDELIALVARAKAARHVEAQLEAKKAQWMKEYEASRKTNRQAGGPYGALGAPPDSGRSAPLPDDPDVLWRIAYRSSRG